MVRCNHVFHCTVSCNTAIFVTSDLDGCFVSLQRMLQFDESQKATLFALRRQYTADVARNSGRHQRLLQQLHSVSSAGDSAQLGAIHVSVEDLTQQLQESVAEEFELFLDYTVHVGKKVLLGTGLGNEQAKKEKKRKGLNHGA